MSHIQQLKSGLIQNQVNETRRGIFRTKTRVTAPMVIPKLRNLTPKKINRRNFNAKAVESNRNLKSSNSFIICNSIPENVVEKLSVAPLTTTHHTMLSRMEPEIQTNLVEISSRNSSEQFELNNNITIGDNASNHSTMRLNDALESEVNIYKQNLKKYDQQANDLIEKFTASLDDKGTIIKKYEQDLSDANRRTCELQHELEELLQRTKLLESGDGVTNCLQLTAKDSRSQDLRLENEKLKQTITTLEIKIAKRDLHIFNLKQVLRFETNKLRDRNDAQEEILKLQHESIGKSHEIKTLREEIKRETNSKYEMIREYNEKILKMKKLLAIREFMLKQKN